MIPRWRYKPVHKIGERSTENWMHKNRYGKEKVSSMVENSIGEGARINPALLMNFL